MRSADTRGGPAFRLLCALFRARFGWGGTGDIETGLQAVAGEWPAVIAAADRHRLLPALAAALADLGLLQAPPSEVAELLAAVRAANTERNQRLAAGLAEAVAALNRAGIEPVLLKGAIRLVDGLYPDPGWRMMNDLDLLAPPGRAAETFAVLQGLGYRTGKADAALPAGHHHLPLLRQTRTGVAIEVHDRLIPSYRRSVTAGRCGCPRLKTSSST
jgi:hypothetical protein